MAVLVEFKLDCVLEVGLSGVYGLGSEDANKWLASSFSVTF
jgi:hypothetical protein